MSFSPPLAEDAADARNVSKNNFKSYIDNLHNSLIKLEGAVNKAINWYDISQEVSKEEYEQKQTEIEGIVKYVYAFLLSLTSEFFLLFFPSSSPILQRLYNGAGAARGVFPGAKEGLGKKLKVFYRNIFYR